MMASSGEEKMTRYRRTGDEHAVSPVVGVMLMLVVTIIIAAVVSAFAGGLSAGKEKAPQVSLETHIKLTGGMSAGPSLIIKDLGGDPVNTRNVKLLTSWANASGIYHVQSTTAVTYANETEEYYPGVASAHYNLTSMNTRTAYYYYNEPYLVVAGKYPTSGIMEDDTPLWFGNYIMNAGDVIKADTNLDTGDYGNLWTDKQIIRDVSLLTQNDIVNVKLIDLKSGISIYDKDVIVEA
jgi:archaeal type IV pilus assembly protein PilA